MGLNNKITYFSFINFYNYPSKILIKPGLPIKIFYFLIIKKKRRYFNFLGFVLSTDFKHRNFSLANTWNNQMLNIKFSFVCPFIYNIYKIFKYNLLFYRVSKFYFINKIKIKDRFIRDDLFKKMVQYDICRVFLDRRFLAPFLFKNKRKNFRRVRKKFRY